MSAFASVSGSLKELADSTPSGLKHFMEHNKAKIRPRKVGEMVATWGQTDLVRKNLEQLEKTHKLKIINQEKILDAIKEPEKRCEFARIQRSHICLN